MLLVATLFMTFVVIRFAMEKRRAYLRQKQLDNARQVTIEAMAAVAETRDPETGAHIKRTLNYVRAIAKELSSSGHYTRSLPPPSSSCCSYQPRCMTSARSACPRTSCSSRVA